MLFFKWPFLLFMLVVLPVFFSLRKTRLWIPWLLLASYFFYGWWNPYYLLLVIYSTALDYLLVALMDHCPLTEQPTGIASRIARGPTDAFLRAAFAVAAVLTILLVCGALLGPASLRPTFAAFAVLVFLMAAGARLASRRIWLFISIFNNLALLLFFKYARFVVQNLNHVFDWLNVSFHFADPSTLMPHGFSYILPVGISFFTFQSMSYTIDFYFGRVLRERNFLRFATFVCFFPQLMAGPIERAKQILPQFQRAPAFEWTQIADGLSLFLVGLFKKVAIANYLATYVDRVYDNPESFGGARLAMATFAFAWQIYFDFSGYTDMARGLARMMGFNLVLNFKNPYLASGLGEFWSRWHISLSTWFRDYLYIPLGGNRRGTLFTYRNLLIVFLVSGFWHGSAWTFLIWGGLHGIGVILTRELERSQFYRDRVPIYVKRVWVFLYVCIAWIFFRAASLDDAKLIVSRIFTTAWHDPRLPALALALIGIVWLYEMIYESRLADLLKFSPLRVGLATFMVLYLTLCTSGGGAFIYFQF